MFHEEHVALLRLITLNTQDIWNTFSKYTIRRFVIVVEIVLLYFTLLIFSLATELFD